MVPGAGACTCGACGVVCKGRYAGCKEVWAAGPRPGAAVRPPPPFRAELGPNEQAKAAARPGPVPEVPAAGDDTLARIAGTIDGLCEQVRLLLLMVSQQQAILAMLVDDRRAAPASRRPIEPADRQPTGAGAPAPPGPAPRSSTPAPALGPPPPRAPARAAQPPPAGSRPPPAQTTPADPAARAVPEPPHRPPSRPVVQAQPAAAAAPDAPALSGDRDPPR